MKRRVCVLVPVVAYFCNEGTLGLCDYWRFGMPVQRKNWLGGVERLGPAACRE